MTAEREKHFVTFSVTSVFSVVKNSGLLRHFIPRNDNSEENLCVTLRALRLKIELCRVSGLPPIHPHPTLSPQGRGL